MTALLSKFAIIATISMLCASMNAEPLGLVLSGGGAKGAYEVGVWQAMEKAGVASNVTVFSGTSVGAINAALFAPCPENAEKLWLQHMEEAFTLNTNRVHKRLRVKDDQITRFWEERGSISTLGDLFKAMSELSGELAKESASNLLEEVISDMPVEGVLDSSPLAKAIDAALPAVWPVDTPSVYVTSLGKGVESKPVTWCLNGEPHERRVKMLMASAAVPVAFSSVQINDVNHIDGGWENNGGDNVPIIPILEKHPDVKTIIVVYLGDETHLRWNRRQKIFIAAKNADVRLIEIIPSENIAGWLGVSGIFDASPETARCLIELGRKDAEEKLKEEGLSH